MANQHKIVDVEMLSRNNQNLRGEFSPINFSIAASAWSASSDSEFPFMTTITNSMVTSSDHVRVDFDRTSIMTASAAVVVTGDTLNGSFKLFSKEVPTGSLSGVYTISKGVEE